MIKEQDWGISDERGPLSFLPERHCQHRLSSSAAEGGDVTALAWQLMGGLQPLGTPLTVPWEGWFPNHLPMLVVLSVSGSGVGLLEEINL